MPKIVWVEALIVAVPRRAAVSAAAPRAGPGGALATAPRASRWLASGAASSPERTPHPLAGAAQSTTREPQTPARRLVARSTTDGSILGIPGSGGSPHVLYDFLPESNLSQGFKSPIDSLDSVSSTGASQDSRLGNEQLTLAVPGSLAAAGDTQRQEYVFRFSFLRLILKCVFHVFECFSF